jgi:hypothetical protein
MTALPDQRQVRALLGDLLGRSVDVTATRDQAGPAVLADYIDDGGDLAAVIACDLRLACGAGAALPMLPADFAKESVKDGAVDPTLLENLNEVLNVAAHLWNQLGQRHVRLRSADPAAAARPEVRDLLASPAGQASFVVEIQGYGGGVLTLATA